MTGTAHCSICNELTNHTVTHNWRIDCNKCKNYQHLTNKNGIFAITDCWQCGPNTIHMVSGYLMAKGSTLLHCMGCKRESINTKITLDE